MSESALHPTPRWRDVVLEQIRIVGLMMWPAALVLLIALAAGTAILVADLSGGGPGFDSDDVFLTVPFAFLAPFAVWRRESRFGQSFLWTLPIDRRRMALARVFAGGVWTLAALAAFMVWLIVLAIAAGAPAMAILGRVPVIGTIAAYVFGSALVLGLRYPLRWLFGGVGFLMGLGVGSDLLTRPDDGEWRHVPGAEAWFSVSGRAWAQWAEMPDAVRWTGSTVLLLGLATVALLAAASRHREGRRR